MNSGQKPGEATLKEVTILTPPAAELAAADPAAGFAETAALAFKDDLAGALLAATDGAPALPQADRTRASPRLRLAPETRPNIAGNSVPPGAYHGRVKFGIFSNGKRHGKSAAEGYDDDLEEIIVAEECGFHEAWISEHIGVNRPATLPAPELMIAKAAALTQRIRFGVGVRLLPLYHPIDIATTAATLDHLTKGRYLFGFGGGGPTSGMEQRGFDRNDRHEMMLESLDLILKCWTTMDPFDYEGRFYRGEHIRVLPKPFQQPYPPLAVASGTDVFVDMAGREGYTLFSSHFDGAAAFKRKSERFLSAAAAAGRLPDRSKVTMIRQIYVADSTREAMDELREGANHELEEDIRFFGDRHLKNFMPPSGRLEDVTFDQVCDKGWFILGTPDEVYARLRQLWEESGGFGTLLMIMGRDWSTREKRTRSLRLFAEHVAPRLASLVPEGSPTQVAAIA